MRPVKSNNDGNPSSLLIIFNPRLPELKIHNLFFDDSWTVKALLRKSM